MSKIKHLLRLGHNHGSGCAKIRGGEGFWIFSLSGRNTVAVKYRPPSSDLLNLSFLVLGVGFVLLGVIAVSSGRRVPNASLPDGKKATTSLKGTLGMFFLGLGLVLVLIGL
jgi:hypothetical protein